MKVTTTLDDFTFPTEGDARNFSAWRDLMDLDTLEISGRYLSEESKKTMLEWGLLARIVIIPTMVNKVALYLLLIPGTRPEVEATLIDEQGQQVIMLEDPEVPGVFFMGGSVGVKDGVADLVPQCDLDNIAPDSGLGILPLIYSAGGELESYPSHQDLHQELFNFLRKVQMPNRDITAETWHAAFGAPAFQDLTQPPVMWPAPPVIRQEVAEGESLNFSLNKVDVEPHHYYGHYGGCHCVLYVRGCKSFCLIRCVQTNFGGEQILQDKPESSVSGHQCIPLLGVPCTGLGVVVLGVLDMEDGVIFELASEEDGNVT